MRRIALPFLALAILAGCAMRADLTPQEQARVYDEQAMRAYLDLSEQYRQAWDMLPGQRTFLSSNIRPGLVALQALVLQHHNAVMAWIAASDDSLAPSAKILALRGRITDAVADLAGALAAILQAREAEHE